MSNYIFCHQFFWVAVTKLRKNSRISDETQSCLLCVHINVWRKVGRNSQKKIPWASRLWVDRRLGPIIYWVLGKKGTRRKRNRKKRIRKKRIRKKRSGKKAQIQLYLQIITFVYCGISVSYNFRYKNVCYLITNFCSSGKRENTSKTAGVQ